MNFFPICPKSALVLSGLVLTSIPVLAQAEGREEFDQKVAYGAAAISEAGAAVSTGVFSHQAFTTAVAERKAGGEALEFGKSLELEAERLGKIRFMLRTVRNESHEIDQTAVDQWRSSLREEAKKYRAELAIMERQGRVQTAEYQAVLDQASFTNKKRDALERSLKLTKEEFRSLMLDKATQASDFGKKAEAALGDARKNYRYANSLPKLGLASGVVAVIAAMLSGRDAYSLWQHWDDAPAGATEPSASVVSQKEAPLKRAPAYVSGRSEQLPMSPAKGNEDREHDVK